MSILHARSASLAHISADSIFRVRQALLDLWPAFSVSPIITHYRWSSLVELAFDINRDYFFPMDTLEPYLSSSPADTNAERYTMIPGLMAIHIRRGDYEGHCRWLSTNAEDFVSVNAFPDMMDQFTVPLRSSSNRELYRKRCYPSIEEIVRKVVDVRGTHAARGVRRLFIMTNGKPDFLTELKDALWEAAEWDVIATSRDMVLNWEQKYIAQAVDQLVAQRAQVLIGNGVSSGIRASSSPSRCLTSVAVLNTNVPRGDDANSEWVPDREHAFLVGVWRCTLAEKLHVLVLCTLDLVSWVLTENFSPSDDRQGCMPVVMFEPFTMRFSTGTR